MAGAALLTAGVGLGATTALTITAETASQLTAPGGLATFAGNLTGMVGTYLALMMVLLVSRIPVTERVLGQHGLLRWHRRLAPWPISLLVAHAVLITAGYAQAARSGVWHEAGTLLFRYPDILIATIGLALICLVGVISIRAIRRRMRREVWWTVHLWLYLALGTETADLVKRRGGQLHELTGSRAQSTIDQHSLCRMVPDLTERDVYVCGPEGFVIEVVGLVRWLGVPDEAIHHEAYAL
jgi:predicted ferric reductase